MNGTTFVPLTRRLTGIFLLCGLVCVALSIMVRLLGRNISNTEFSAFAVALPLVVLLAGNAFLRKAARTTSDIDARLAGISATDDMAEFTLQPLSGQEAAATGWNRIVEQTSMQRTLAGLEERLGQSLGGLREQKSKNVLDTLQEGVAVTNAEGKITFVNRSFRALLNLDADGSLDGKQIDDLLPLDADEKEDDVREQILQLSRPIAFELNRGEEATAGVLRVARQPMHVEGTTVPSQVWSIRDVTQQKLADEMRNHFVYSATHELRTPLSNIKAYAETLALNDDIDVEQQKEFCNTINAEATRLSRFVEELLNISQMEAGSLSLARHETDVERLVTEVCEKVNPQIKKKEMQFETQIPPKLPKLSIDKDKIVAALVNLLGNAVKYTPRGGGINFTVEQSDRDILFHVEDTGFGISEEELTKVFDKFFRSSDSRVLEVSGSGLGLAFTQEVARLHDGKLSVHSTLNRGSKFTLALPVS